MDGYIETNGRHWDELVPLHVQSEYYRVAQFKGAKMPVVLTDGANTYVHGLDLISSTSSAGVQTYYLTDGLGSTTNTTDAAGATTYTYSYDAFGKIRSENPSGGSNQWLFAGEQRDGENGLYYLRARYYDPIIGRFLTRDPFLADGADPNSYTYSGNNPVNNRDRTGLLTESVTLLSANPLGASKGILGQGCSSAIIGLVIALALVVLFLAPPPVGFAVFAGNIILGGLAASAAGIEAFNIAANCGEPRSPFP